MSRVEGLDSILIVNYSTHTALFDGVERIKMRASGGAKPLKALFSWTLFKICKSLDGLGYLFLDFFHPLL